MNINLTFTDILLLIVLGLLLYVIFFKNAENLTCLTKLGPVTEMPSSSLVNLNAALVASDSLGQSPHGDPRFWTATGSPITQGQYGSGRSCHHNQEENQGETPIYTQDYTQQPYYDELQQD